jgi:hypothetical protein
MIGLFIYLLLQIPMGSSGSKPSSGNTYTFVQKTGWQTCTTPCAITVTSTGTGHLLYVQADVSSNSSYITAVSAGCSGGGGGGWVIPSSSQSGSHGSVSSAYCLSSTSGVTSITVTLAASGFVNIWEYSALNAPLFDTCGIVNNSVAATTQPGVALTLNTSSETILQGMNAFVVINSISIYGNFSGSGGKAIADLENTSSGNAPTWTFASSGTSAGDACAFK